MCPIITLTTDFGLSDGYVAQVKGVILGICPEVQLVDVTHRVPPQDVLRGAGVLDETVEAFPAEAVHLVVVDPGVGTGRAMVAVETERGRFVGPDNGVLSLVARRFPPRRVVRLTERRFWRQTVSATFHGRDVMGPVAAHWSRGLDISEFGPPLERPLIELPIPEPQRLPDGIAGEVLWADTFGNLVTNIDQSLLPTDGRERMTVEVAGRTIRGIHRTYGETAAGELLALVGSSGRLEVAINQGHAANALQAARGTPVRVAFSSSS